jgi:4-hydroxybutyrate CoA-transferase
MDYPLSELQMIEERSSEVMEKIALNIVERIPDGATLQMGIGLIPNAVLGYLHTKIKSGNSHRNDF